MNPSRDYTRYVRRTPSTICAIVIEGLGDVPFQGRTPMEAAHCPCLDRLASESECGQLLPLSSGLSPGGATALLAFLGYDPAEFSLPAELEEVRPDEDGRARLPRNLPAMDERYLLRPAVVTSSTLARDVAVSVGMEVLETGPSVAEHFQTLQTCYDHHDFFLVYLSVARGDGAEERFRAKVAVLEAVDHSLPVVLALEPDVIVVAGDCSVPAVLGRASWHPAPFLLWSRYCRMDRVRRFTEKECAGGTLGTIPACDAMPLMLANALKLLPVGP